MHEQGRVSTGIVTRAEHPRVIQGPLPHHLKGREHGDAQVVEAGARFGVVGAEGAHGEVCGTLARAPASEFQRVRELVCLFEGERDGIVAVAVEGALEDVAERADGEEQKHEGEERENVADERQAPGARAQDEVHGGDAGAEAEHAEDPKSLQGRHHARGRRVAVGDRERQVAQDHEGHVQGIGWAAKVG